jgi:prepilin-type N-terminal cleavage/methylation domain-containing protein
MPPLIKPRARAFTLVEVLVALTLMAVVVPVAMQGLHIASLAGEVSERKALAMRIADRVLNEAIVTGQGQSGQNGLEKAGSYEFHWTVRNEPWSPPPVAQSGSSLPNGVNQNANSANTMQQLTAEVTFTAKGAQQSVRVSTLVNATIQGGANPPPNMTPAQ